jgi:hypothetical protein
MGRGSIIATSTKCLWCDQSLFKWMGGSYYEGIHKPNECPKRPKGSPETKEIRMGVFFDKDNNQINPEDYLKPKNEVVLDKKFEQVSGALTTDTFKSFGSFMGSILGIRK